MKNFHISTRLPECCGMSIALQKLVCTKSAYNAIHTWNGSKKIRMCSLRNHVLQIWKDWLVDVCLQTPVCLHWRISHQVITFQLSSFCLNIAISFNYLSWLFVVLNHFECLLKTMYYIYIYYYIILGWPSHMARAPLTLCC